MNKFAKSSLITLSLGIIALSVYYLKRQYNDQTEDRILKQMLAKYQGCPVKGTWIQRQGNHYICEITVMTDHQWQHHQFRTDASNDLMLND